MLQNISAGLSAIRAANVGLAVTSNNIANQATPGFVRSTVDLATRPPINMQGFSIGTGVEVAGIRRVHDEALDAAITQNTSESGAVEQQLQLMQRLENALASGDADLSASLDRLFNSLTELSVQPDDLVRRSEAIRAFQQVAADFNDVSATVDSIREGVNEQIQADVDQINALASELSDVTAQIQDANNRRIPARDLENRRGQLLNELAGFIEVQLNPKDDTIMLAGGSALIGGRNFQPLEAVYQGDRTIVVRQGEESALNIQGGSLGGLMAMQDARLVDFQANLDTLAQQLMISFDTIHATGLGIDGTVTQLQSQRTVEDVTLPLADVLSLPITAGELYLSLTDSATNETEMHAIAIDPQVDSLEDLATRITTDIAGLQAIANPDAGSLTILAAQGLSFNFTGSPGNRPAGVAALTGTSEPTVSGLPADGRNRNLSLQFSDNGQIGVTADLRLEVRDSGGALLEVHEIGAGYEPGTPIDITGGLSVQLSPGTVVAGEQVQVASVGTPDSSGILSALGIGSLFTGHDARTIQVAEHIVDNPFAFATSLTGEVGDTWNLQRMLDLRDADLLGPGTTLNDAVGDLVAGVGHEVASLQDTAEHLGLVGDSLNSQRDSISGVDVNEELVKMLQYQRLFQTAARFLSTVDELTAELLNII